jgi:thiamine-phosphate pyrophosphorylase
MLREKDLDARPLLDLALALRRVTERRGAMLLINDRLDVARAAGADGVHLPAAGLPPGRVRQAWPGALIGVSTHHAHEVRRAGEAGATYATFGPVFDTPSKRPFGPPKGLEALAAACGPLPLVALGGIDPPGAARARAAGASAVACIRAILSAPDPARALEALLAAFA